MNEEDDTCTPRQGKGLTLITSPFLFLKIIPQLFSCHVQQNICKLRGKQPKSATLPLLQSIIMKKCFTKSASVIEDSCVNWKLKFHALRPAGNFRKKPRSH